MRKYIGVVLKIAGHKSKINGQLQISTVLTLGRMELKLQLFFTAIVSF